MAADVGQEARKGRPIPFVTFETEVPIPGLPLVACAVRCPSLPRSPRRGRAERGAYAAPCRPRPVRRTCERRINLGGALPRAGSASRLKVAQRAGLATSGGSRARPWCAAGGKHEHAAELGVR